MIKPPVKRFSWTTVLADMEIDESIKVDALFARVVRQRISRDVKLKFPDRVYETRTENKVLIIKRTA